MKVVGILLIGLMSGIAAAAFSFGSGGTVWAALLNYIGVGMVATVLGVVVLIWRAWEVERPGHSIVLSGATSTSK